MKYGTPGNSNLLVVNLIPTSTSKNARAYRTQQKTEYKADKELI